MGVVGAQEMIDGVKASRQLEHALGAGMGQPSVTEIQAVGD